MLLSLQVKNLALLEEASITFGDGLNVFSGETGAGKSLVIGSVGLALGGRVHSGLARDESKPVEVELVFQLDNACASEEFKDLDVPIDEDGLIIIRRQIRDGRSSTKINGATVNNSGLKRISEKLLDIHGQHEHQSLLHEKNYLGIVDRYGGEAVQKALLSYQELFKAYRQLLEELGHMQGDESERAREIDILKYEIREISDANLRSGEDRELEDAFQRMNNSRKILEATEEAAALIDGDNSAGEQFDRALRSMSAASELDKDAAELTKELTEIDSLLTDFRRDLRAYMDSLSFSEEEYQYTVSRLDCINGLKLKYGSSIEDILASEDEKNKRLDALNDYDRHRTELEQEIESTKEKLRKRAKTLSDERKKCSHKLEELMQKALTQLSFENARFCINLHSTDGDYGGDGIDTVRFLLSANPGEEPKPLKDTASGGELSRIMLALKTVLADTDEIPTLIFDEIDTGISGRTAQRVSESLAELSGGHQVILITHLPQIASMADHHFLIRKDVKEGRTSTCIEELFGDDLISELGRLLSGAETTDKVMENAREMKALANEKKEKSRKNRR